MMANGMTPEAVEVAFVSSPEYILDHGNTASGFLTGKYRSAADLSKSPRGQAVKKYLDDRGLRILKALDQVAGQHSSTPARVALAWLIARPSITAPIASATSVEQLQDLLLATKLELTPADIEELNRASSYDDVAVRTA